MPPTHTHTLNRTLITQEELAAVRGERQADAEDYERRLAEAVDSAEKWKQFAEGLQVGWRRAAAC
jgi:hypothetical protein